MKRLSSYPDRRKKYTLCTFYKAEVEMLIDKHEVKVLRALMGML
ncbi:hypothetical protein chiPu_0023434, partial [Chiloscyllium punctatum]|nr:hypothetical protein [Chiloscyllium punctatum]